MDPFNRASRTWRGGAVLAPVGGGGGGKDTGAVAAVFVNNVVANRRIGGDRREQQMRSVFMALLGDELSFRLVHHLDGLFLNLVGHLH